MFDSEKLYLSTDPAFDVLGTASTRAHWRSQGQGPPFVKLGAGVAYRGQDLLDWIESRVVQPTERPVSAA